MQDPTEGKHRLSIRRRMPATREVVFEAWTNPQGIREWMCPGDTVSAEAKLDLRAGGSYRIVMKSKTRDYIHTGVYQVVEPPSKLVFTWSREEDELPTLVTVEFLAHGNESELVLTHERFADPDVMKRYQGGWATIAEKLAAYLARQVSATGTSKNKQKEKALETRTVNHEITFAAGPREVYEALMNDKQHAAFSGAPATIDRKAGGKLTCYGDHLEGTSVELKENERIVQDWRAKDWPQGHYSRVTYTLTPLAEGRNTLLSFEQTGVPADKFEDINKGWHSHYWLKMAAYFRDRKVAIVRRFMEEFKNKANLDIVDELFTSDFILHLPGTTIPPGHQGQKDVGKMIFDAFSGVHVTVNDTVVEGDRVVERHTARARHTGSFYGISPTGRDVFWTENHIYRLRDGKIAETWSEISFHDLMAQISDKSVAPRKAG